MDWSQTAERHKAAIANLSKEIKDYGYGDENQSFLTDERLCAWLVSQLRQAKKRLFNIVETLYGLHFESKLDNLAEELRDEVDVFSDEIKTRHFRCKQSALLEELVRHDTSLVDGTKRFNKELESLYDQLIKGLKNPFDGRYDKEMWEKIKSILKDLDKQLDIIVQAFKEREIICNIRPLSLQKTYEIIRKKTEVV